ncbi:MAG: ATP-grasp domain-containing protein [Candidatus Rokuibacteriota bacterium]
MDRQILFVFGAQASGPQGSAPNDPLLAARNLNYRTAVMGPSLSCNLSEKLLDHYEPIDLRRHEPAVVAARALHQACPIGAVVCYDDEAVAIAARIAAVLGVPGHPVEAADAARDKVLMKQRFQAAGVPIARYVLAADEDDAVRWAAGTGYPVVIKPVRGSASQGVIRADSEHELRQAYRRVRRIVRDYALDTGGRPDTAQLVEAYLDGSEVSVELLVRDGTPHPLCVFEKPRPLHGPFFEESIYVTPARLPAAQRRQVEALAVRGAVALGLRHGFAHCEIRLSSAGPFVLETAARVIGGACSRVLGYAVGEDIHSCIIRLALGEEFPVPQQRPGAVGAMMLPVMQEGRLVGVRGVARAASIPGVQDVMVCATSDEIVLSFPEQSCYIGFLTARAETPKEVVDLLTEAADQIDLELAPLA